MPYALQSLVAVYLPRDGLIHLTGGKSEERVEQHHFTCDPLNDLYDKSPANIPTSRTWAAGAVVKDKIYVIGGNNGSKSLSTNEMYDPQTDKWLNRALLPVPRHGLARENPVINGKIYITYGLYNEVTHSMVDKNSCAFIYSLKLRGTFHARVDEYDPSTDTWSTKQSGVNPRDGVACGVIGGKLHLVGGRDERPSMGESYHEIYSPYLGSRSQADQDIKRYLRLSLYTLFFCIYEFMLAIG